MRITQNTLFNNLRNNISNNAARLLNAQETVATQKRFNRLSDNPIDGGRVLDLNGLVSRSTQYLSNIERVNSLATTQDSTLDQVNTLIGNAKTLLLKETNQVTSTSTTREATRIDVAQLTTQLVQAANTEFDGQYIFSGSATDRPAFTDAQVSTAPAAIAGRAAVATQQVADATKLTYDNYQIQFTAPGQFDVVDTTAGTTVLSNQSYTSGSPIRFDGIALTLSNSPGAPATGDTYTITSSLPGVYQGDNQVQTVEVQSGSRVPQNIPGNRAFQGVGVTNGVDVFSIMNQVNTALRTNDRTAMSALLNQLDAAQTQISNERASVGGRMNMLTDVKARQTDIQSNLEQMSSNLEDIDVADAMVKLNKQQDTYDATLAAGSKIVQHSLLDFLQ